jgi:hypothetical protein
MSLTSNGDNSAYLILNFGLYPSSEVIMNSFENDKNNQILKLNPSLMKSKDWDHVLDLIIKNKKCITL